MDYNTYKQRYLKAYEKQGQQLNILSDVYSDEELRQAYRIYNDHTIWYYKSFKPATLAQTNVVYYDYQIKQALDWRLRFYHSPEYAYDLDEVKADCHSNPDWIVAVIKEWYCETGGRPVKDIKQELGF